MLSCNSTSSLVTWRVMQKTGPCKEGRAIPMWQSTFLANHR